MKITKRILSIVTLLVVAVTLVACKKPAAGPKISGAEDKSVPRYVAFDARAGVTATDASGADLTEAIVITGEVNVDEPAVYEVKYYVEDSKGLSAEVKRKITVTEEDAEGYVFANYLQGVNYDLLPATEKGKLFAAAENYLLDNVYAGIPVYNGASKVLFADRVSLFSEDYNGVMGFGTAFSELVDDDSTVFMYGDTKGQPGEYTWRSSYNTDPQLLNPWLADDSNTSDFVGMFTGALYDFYFSEDKTGYVIAPSLAKEEPIAAGTVEVVNGKTYSNIWQIPVRDDLEWKYHPDTDTSGFSEGHEKLDANDWLWTWKYALSNNWFRARTGGGDFVSKGVKGAAAYLDNPTEENWSKVGLKVVDGNTIQVEFNEAISAFDFKYGFAGGTLEALNQDVFEWAGEDYGTEPKYVAASGIYYFDTWTNGQLLLFKKNELHPEADMYHYTGYQYRYIANTDLIFEEFTQGKLESASIPPAKVEEYSNDERVKVSPAATTWRIGINAFGTVANRDAYIDAHPQVGLDKTYVPKPILMYKEMRQALYFGLDREHAAVEVAKTYMPQHTLYAPTYFLDGESGLSVRGTPEGQDTFDRFAGATNGYVPDAAKNLFKQAVAQAIADGHYVKGTAEEYTEIELTFYFASSGSSANEAWVQNMVEQYEALLVDDVNFVKVIFETHNVTFPGQYYDHALIAKGDLYLGGISGSQLNAPSFLDVFADDNRGGFTFTWGIDTTTANIKVEYINLQGKEVKEIWSFNAIVEALQRKTYVKNGQEQKDWSNPEDLINAYEDMAGNVVDSIRPDTDGLAPHVIDATLEEKAEELDVDEVKAFLVTREDGVEVLYVLSRTGNNWSLVGNYALATEDDIQDLIAGYVEGEVDGLELVEAVFLVDDDAVAANEYITEELELFTYQEIADELGFDVESIRVYAITYTYSGATYSDAVVVIKVGDFFIFGEWL